MKILPLLVLALAVAGCSTTVPKRSTGERIRGVGVDEFIIEGCAYIEVSAGSLTHKGNCPNPIHPSTTPVQQDGVRVLTTLYALGIPFRAETVGDSIAVSPSHMMIYIKNPVRP